MGYKSNTIKCSQCGHDEFFVDTLGIEHCSKCFAPTMYIHNEPTGGLSYKQLNQAKELEEERQHHKGGTMLAGNEKIKGLIREGLCIDGAHHKQWYLEEIGKLCGMKIEIENRQGVTKGIPP